MFEFDLPQDKLIVVLAATQQLLCYEGSRLIAQYPVSTALNGLGESMGSYCTPRGWHAIHSIIGLDAPLDAVFVAREFTGELYSKDLAASAPDRDWILTRILRLEGLEPGRNKEGACDSFERYIYIHGTPETDRLGKPASHGCIRMSNESVMALSLWAKPKTLVYIE